MAKNTVCSEFGTTHDAMLLVVSKERTIDDFTISYDGFYKRSNLRYLHGHLQAVSELISAEDLRKVILGGLSLLRRSFHGLWRVGLDGLSRLLRKDEIGWAVDLSSLIVEGLCASSPFDDAFAFFCHGRRNLFLDALLACFGSAGSWICWIVGHLMFGCISSLSEKEDSSDVELVELSEDEDEDNPSHRLVAGIISFRSFKDNTSSSSSWALVVSACGILRSFRVIFFPVTIGCTTAWDKWLSTTTEIVFWSISSWRKVACKFIIVLVSGCQSVFFMRSRWWVTKQRDIPRDLWRDQAVIVLW